MVILRRVKKSKKVSAFNLISKGVKKKKLSGQSSYDFMKFLNMFFSSRFYKFGVDMIIDHLFLSSTPFLSVSSKLEVQTGSDRHNSSTGHDDTKSFVNVFGN